MSPVEELLIGEIEMSFVEGVLDYLILKVSANSEVGMSMNIA